MKVKGVTVVLVVQEDGVELIRSAPGGRSSKKIYYRQITAVQYRRASWFANGYIQFTVPGGEERKGGAMRALFDENSVVFGFSARKKFDNARRLIEQRMQSAFQPTAPAAVASATDELERLASLVERGFLTREEFELKKRQLLA
ncbi:MAG TPA: SHOCT domain-containing protein [Devosia sp.]|jgi:hypothetical protein|nr:SHOCT domain-containing protein [Devosia sp.]